MQKIDILSVFVDISTLKSATEPVKFDKMHPRIRSLPFIYTVINAKAFLLPNYSRFAADSFVAVDRCNALA
jgi:hypothetical protein